MNAETARIKQAADVADLVDTIANGEEYKAGSIKPLNKTSTKWEVAKPTSEDPNDTATTKAFFAVPLFAKKTMQAPQNDPDGEKKEKRIVTVLRTSNGIPKGEEGRLIGRVFPELVWFSPTALKRWGAFVKEVVTKYGVPLHHVLAEFRLEVIKGKDFTWNVPVVTVARLLTKEEIEYVEQLLPAIETRDAKYAADEEYEDYEAQAGVKGVSKKSDDDEDAHDMSRKSQLKKDASIDDEDEDAPEDKPKSAAKPKAKPATKPKDDDDEEPEAKPKPKPEAKPKDDDDEEDETPPPAKPKKPSIDDDED